MNHMSSKVHTPITLPMMTLSLRRLEFIIPMIELSAGTWATTPLILALIPWRKLVC